MKVENILDEVQRHHYAHPDHGYNCACMDEYIQILRAALSNDYDFYDPSLKVRKAYVMMAAVNHYY